MKYKRGDLVFWTPAARGAIRAERMVEVLNYTEHLVTVKLNTGPSSHVIKRVEERFLKAVPIPPQNRVVR